MKRYTADVNNYNYDWFHQIRTFYFVLKVYLNYLTYINKINMNNEFIVNPNLFKI